MSADPRSKVWQDYIEKRIDVRINRLLEKIAPIIGEAIADQRKEQQQTVHRLEATNARLLVRIAMLESGERRTDDAVVIDARQVLGRRAA